MYIQEHWTRDRAEYGLAGRPTCSSTESLDLHLRIRCI